MNLNIAYLKDLDVVEVVAGGLVNHAMRNEIFCASQAALCKNGCKKLLINKVDGKRVFDQRMTGALSIVNLMRGLSIPQKTLIAVLSKNVEQYDEFFEVMARIKDFSVKSFTNREIALQWLCQSCV